MNGTCTHLLNFSVQAIVAAGTSVVPQRGEHFHIDTFYTGGGLTTHEAPRAIGDHGAPVSLPKLKKAYEKGTRGISWGPLLTPGPRAVPEFPNGQSAPVYFSL
ncbi:unnamed protein product, partial [Staurois parvus]